MSGSDDEAKDDDGDKNANDIAIDGTEIEDGDEGKQAPKRRRKKDSYDYMDDFIDDSEFIEMIEYADTRKSKHKGFVIYRGRIQRDDEDDDEHERLIEGDQEEPTDGRKVSHFGIW